MEAEGGIIPPSALWLPATGDDPVGIGRGVTLGSVATVLVKVGRYHIPLTITS